MSTLHVGKAKERLEAAVTALVSSQGQEHTLEKLYSLFYVQSATQSQATAKDGIYTMPSSSLDLAFDDSLLDNVEDAWKSTLADGEDSDQFMTFEDREQMNGEDDDDDD